MADAAVEAKQFLVSCREAVGHKFDPSVIATVHGLGYADTERAIMIVGKLGEEAAQRAVDCQRTRLINNTPTLTARNCHGRPTAMAVTGSKAEFVQLARVTCAQTFQSAPIRGPTLREAQRCHAPLLHDRAYSP